MHAVLYADTTSFLGHQSLEKDIGGCVRYSTQRKQLRLVIKVLKIYLEVGGVLRACKRSCFRQSKYSKIYLEVRATFHTDKTIENNMF